MSKPIGFALVVWVACVRGAAAQESEPLPTRDEAVEPAQPAQPLDETRAAGLGVAKRPPRWRTTLRLSGVYDTNVSLASSEQVEDLSGELLGSLNGQFEKNRWRVALQLDGGGSVYKKLSDYSAPVFAGSFNAEGPLAARTRLVIRQDYRRDYVRNILRFVDAGLVPGKLLTSAYTGAIGIDEKLAPRLSFLADASYDRVSYEGDERPAGDTLSLSTGLAWALRESEHVDLRYVYRDTESGLDVGQSHQAALSWNRRLTAKLDAGLSLGVGRDRPLGSSETVTPWSVGGRLAGRYRRHGLEVGYRHSLDQAYGFGRSLLFDSASLGDTYALTPRLSAGVRASLSRGRDPIDTSYRLSGGSLQAELGWRVSPRGSAGLTYSYVTTREAGQPDISSHVLEFSLAHSRPWQ